LGYFDRAFQGPNSICGTGFTLYFSDSHYLTGKANLGPGTNNVAEFNALLALLKSAMERNVQTQQVLGDSKFCIDWMLGTLQLDHLVLLQLGQQLKILSSHFSPIHFMHIYRELNGSADTLSKEALSLNENVLVVEEFAEGDLLSSWEGNFIMM
jgi:ribonuclease HI